MAKKPQIAAPEDIKIEDTKTGPALAEQTGTPQPAGGTAAAAAEAAGDQTLAADASAPRKGPPGYTVVVTALQDRRWRIGRQFGREPVSIPAEELTEAEVEALSEDPMLSLAVIDAPY